jgi:pSer/pThr/pTyr-binding forkhead associated (FHA) protein
VYINKDLSISKNHAIIEKVNEKFALKDLGSLNGTYLNNQKLLHD